MYKWRIKVWLEGECLCLTGSYVGPETTSGDVANKIFAGSKDDFTGIMGDNDQHNLFIRKGSVAAFDISPW